MTSGTTIRNTLIFLFLASSVAVAGIYRVRTTDPARLLQEGRAALDAGDAEGALRRVHRLESLGQANHALLLRGETWLAVAQSGGNSDVAPPEALRQALRCLSRVDGETTATEAALRAGECLARLGAHRAAVDVLTPLLQRWPDRVEVHRWLAVVYIDLKSPNQAIEHLTAWGVLAPEEGRPYRWIGLFHKDYAHEELAIPAYREALRRRLDPSMRAEVVRELADALMGSEADYQSALDVLLSCPEEFARTPEIRILRAEAMWGLGQVTEATAFVDEILRLRPEDGRALRLRGRIALTADDPRRALPLFERAVQADGFDLASRQHLVEVCQQLGDEAGLREHRSQLEKAREARRKLTLLHLAARERPWDDIVRVAIAQLSLEVRRPREAAAMLQAALACNPENAEAKRLLQSLTSGQGLAP